MHDPKVEQAHPIASHTCEGKLRHPRSGERFPLLFLSAVLSQQLILNGQTALCRASLASMGLSTGATLCLHAIHLVCCAHTNTPCTAGNQLQERND